MRMLLQIRSSESLHMLTMGMGSESERSIHPQLLRSSVVNKNSQKLIFFACGVCNAIVNANGDGNAKSPPHFHSMARWERRTGLAAAVSPMAAEHYGWEFEVHDDAMSIFYLRLCEIFVLCFTGT